MKHIAVRFGPKNALVGVITDSSEKNRFRATGIVILNAGVIHRVGPNRLHTSLAMRLASHGFTVLRFDYSGVGDSDPNPAFTGLPTRNVHETQAAMDFLARCHGVDDFILVGLCSGADNAFRVATTDTRIVGLILLDGYAYPTSAFRRRRFAQKSRRLLSVSGISRAAARLGAALSSRNCEASTDGQGLMIKPCQADAERHMRDLVQRGVHILSIYTPELGVYNYTEQFFDFFPSIATHHRVRVEFFEHADHLFTQLKHQVALSDLTAGWVMAACT